MRRLRFELLAMALAVLLAGISVVATFGSARAGDLVFCRIVDERAVPVDGGDHPAAGPTAPLVVGITTDCSEARPPGPPGTGAVATADGVSAPVSSSPSPGPGADASFTLGRRGG